MCYATRQRRVGQGIAGCDASWVGLAHLGNGRPVRELLHALANGWVRQDVTRAKFYACGHVRVCLGNHRFVWQSRGNTMGLAYVKPSEARLHTTENGMKRGCTSLPQSPP